MLSDSAGILFYPAKVSGRVGAVWAREGLTASIFGNYKSGVTNIAEGRKGASFTTFGATLTYYTGERDRVLSPMALEFSEQNLHHRNPPLYILTWKKEEGE